MFTIYRKQLLDHEPPLNGVECMIHINKSFLYIVSIRNEHSNELEIVPRRTSIVEALALGFSIYEYRGLGRYTMAPVQRTLFSTLLIYN